MGHTVFITREEEESQELSAALRKEGIELLATSMIKIEAVEFSHPIAQTDWIFFSSKNGVRQFFSQKPEIHSQRFAAVGQGTADELSAYATPAFIGKHIDTRITAEDFKTEVKNGSVLFPQSEQSRKTIQRVFGKNQVHELICYRTVPNGREVGAADVVIFTSPSNVEAYFSKNKLFHFQKIIAFGHSTEESLKNHGVQEILIPESLTTESLMDTIKTALRS